ncbi:MAG TPA: redoxin domain-containing protein [Candidatus Korarchaeota archaeon]|nr:redoxin domain-containing protein [Candidatus Korarchaeota archaeon]
MSESRASVMRAAAVALLGVLLLEVAALYCIPRVGQKVNFTLTTRDGQTVSSDNIPWDAVVLVFFQHTCPHCRTDLQRMADTLRACNTPLDYRVIAVGVSRNLSADYEFFLTLPENDWLYADGSPELAQAFVLRVTPTWIVLDSSAAVVLAEEGTPDGDTLCSVLGGVLGGSGKFPYLLVGSSVDEEAAAAFSAKAGGAIVRSLPERASYLVVGGPFAHSGKGVINPAKEAASKAGVYFTRIPSGIVMEVRPASLTLTVTGADWAKKDYAVVFALRKGLRIVAGAMGCTRFGTKAALLWLENHLDELRPGEGYVLQWEDSNSDGDVQVSEVTVLQKFYIP